MSVDPPRPKPPPLLALRAFEAAARLGGFARAADELSVTPGAISQHIKNLEDWAGSPLFVRKAQGITLSPLGARILPGVSAAFDQLGQTAQTLRSHVRDRMHIAALPALAQLWLSPRLPRIRAAFPNVEFSVTALEEPPNLLRDPFGMAVFYAPPGTGHEIGRDEVFPVCAPALAAQLSSPEDVANHPCLSDSAWPDDWAIWLRAVGARPETQVRGPSFSLYALAVAEAVNGAGILMGHRALVQTHLDSGALVSPFKGSARMPQILSVQLPPGATGLATQVLQMLRP